MSDLYLSLPHSLRSFHSSHRSSMSNLVLIAKTAKNINDIHIFVNNLCAFLRELDGHHRIEGENKETDVD